MKNKLKIAKIFVLTLFLFLSLSLTTKIDATSLANNELLKLNNKTITKTSTLDDITAMFGQYKVATPNAFGGYSYSFHDNAYTWYLIVEMNASGQIKGYGAIGGNFVAKRYAYGDPDDSYIWTLSGTVIKEWGTDAVYGIYEYNSFTNNDLTTFWNNYESEPSKHLYNLQQHAVIASKVLAKREGYNFPQVAPSEEIFYMNEQLKYNKSSLYEYSVNTGVTKSIIRTMSRTDEFYNDLPNPIRLGKMTEGYEYAEGYKYVLYDIQMKNYDYSTCQTSMYYINPEFLAKRSTVELLADEKAKLEAAKAQYALYKQHGEAIGEMYDIEPVYDKLPLVAGKYNKNVLLHVTDYLNIARAGLGIGTLTLDDDIADAAQHKAVLVTYMNLNGMETGHLPRKPEGVSDAFYQKAQTYMNENLYTGNVQTSIDLALNDAYGGAIECGHRYNLLDPSFTKWGVGAVSRQGAHKFAGTTTYTNELVAWPSNGIFPLDMVSRGIGNWTAQFYKNYKVTADTEVTIKCLNTNKTYEITKANTKSSSDKLLQVTGDYLVTFRDDNITYQDGDVFEITLHNVKDSSNKTVDYTYRSVFTSFYQLESVSVSDISLSLQNLSLVKGQAKRIYATVLPENASNKLLKFESSNTNVATVSQDGTITATGLGQTTIKVIGDNITKTINVTVSNTRKGDLNKDNLVDSADAAIALNLYKYNNATAEDINIGDMDENGMIDSADAAMILNVYKYN